MPLPLIEIFIIWGIATIGLIICSAMMDFFAKSEQKKLKEVIKQQQEQIRQMQNSNFPN
jgi:hypothetical protein